MKKIFILFIVATAIPNLNAQDITDAVRYAQDEIQGTARFRAMAGAFGALGGDMSAVSINPAGSAVFNTSHASVTFANLNVDNDTRYFNGFSSSSDTKFDVNQAGGVFVFNNYNPNSPWKKFTLGLAYDKTGNYDNDWRARGINPVNSVGEYFLANAQGLRLDEISALPGETLSEAYAAIGSIYGFSHQQAFLGYESFILDPLTDSNNNTAYTTNTGTGEFDQDYRYVARGYNGKFSINLATQFEEFLFLGINLNTHFLNYERSTFLNEINDNANASIREVQFDNSLYTTGSGFSFQIGAIAKLNNIVRLGLSYNSPTWYRINEETTQFLATTREDENEFITQIINPDVVNIFPEYKFRSPGKLTGSLALVFGDKGLISFDYSFKDYGNTEFSPTSDSYFAAQNAKISDNLTAASSYRIGGEYRFKRFSFRGGYRLDESPYEDEDFYGDLTGYSFGLGYNFGNMKLDIALENSERTVNEQLYNIGLTDAAQIDINNTDVTLSLAFSI